MDLIVSLGKLAIAVGTAIYEAVTMSPEEKAAVQKWADDKTEELAAMRALFRKDHEALTDETHKVIADEKKP